MKGMKGIQRSSHPELTRMVKLLRKQNLGLHDEKKALVVMNAELVEALENIASPSIYDCEDGHCMSEMANAALTKAKRIG